jgi:hypothetical protein
MLLAIVFAFSTFDGFTNSKMYSIPKKIQLTKKIESYMCGCVLCISFLVIYQEIYGQKGYCNQGRSNLSFGTGVVEPPRKLHICSSPRMPRTATPLVPLEPAPTTVDFGILDL